MNTNLNTKYFLFDNNIYKQIYKRLNKKNIFLILFNIIIQIICTLLILINFNITISFLSLVIITFSIIIVIYFFSLILFNHQDNYSSKKRVYVLLDDKFFVIKFKKNEIVDQKILDYIIKKIYYKKDEQNLSFNKTSFNNDLIADDVYEFSYIVNIHSVKNFADKLQIMCDYEDVLKSNSYYKEEFIIYKYYTNFDLLFNYIDNRQQLKNQKLYYESNNAIQYVLDIKKISSSKRIYIFTCLCLFLIKFISNFLFSIFIPVVIALYIFLIYLKKHAIKKTNDNNIESIIKKSIKIDRLLVAFLSFICILFLIFNVNLIQAFICVVIILVSIMLLTIGFFEKKLRYI